MAKSKRVISVDFINDSGFKIKTSNRAKLLYFLMLANSDDKGFCNNADELVLILNAKETTNDSLLSEKYEDSLKELCQKGFIIKLTGKHENDVYLIRHWYVHNNIPEARITPSNYEKYIGTVVELCQDDNESVYNLISKCNTSAKQVHSKCKASVSTNKIKLNKSKVNKSSYSKKNNNIGKTNNNGLSNDSNNNNNGMIDLPDEDYGI